MRRPDLQLSSPLGRQAQLVKCLRARPCANRERPKTGNMEVRPGRVRVDAVEGAPVHALFVYKTRTRAP